MHGLIKSAFVLAISCFACGPHKPPVGPPGGAVVLAASTSKPEYAAGETVEVRLQLSNNGSSDVQLSNMAWGNIKVISVKKDGVDVRTRSGTLKLDGPLADAIQQQLASVSSGRSMTITWTSVADPVLSGSTLQWVGATDPSPFVDYLVAEPGKYDVTVSYRYGGPDTGDPSIYRAETNQATATFTVR